MKPLPNPFCQAGFVALVLMLFAPTLQAQTAPTITTQPLEEISVDHLASATMSVVASGSGLSYQWLINSNPIAGANSATYTIASVRNYVDVGTYQVVVSNSAGSVTSTGCRLRVYMAPYFYSQPVSQTALPGATISFWAGLMGWPIPAVQWYKNGVAIPGATSTGSFQISSVTSADAGVYTCVLTSPLGTATSDPATLTVNSGQIVTAAPQDANIQAGGIALFCVGATGMLISYQWQVQPSSSQPWTNLADQDVYSGAYTSTLRITGVTAAMTGYRYRCIVTNMKGSEASGTATLTVQFFAPYSGGYFGSFDSGGGRWAIYLSGTTGTFLAYLPDRHSVIVQSVTILPDGNFSVTGRERLAGDAGATGSGAAYTLTGQITGTAAAPSVRTVTGALTGLGETFTGAFRAGNGTLTLAAGDFYTALALKGDAGRVCAVIGYGGDIVSVVVTPTMAEGFAGTVALSTATTATLTANLSGGAFLGLNLNLTDRSLAATLTPSGSGARAVNFLGLGSATATTSKLAGLSIRGLAGQGDQTLIVGYVVSGADAKPVLVRAVGPSLIPQGVSGVLANPRLRIFNAAGALLSENEDWGGGGALQAMFQSLGAFAFTSPLDAALATSLPDGVYTAHAGSTAGANGVALLEAYDADASRTTRLVALSARALAGTGDNTLIAGFVITGNAPVTLLIRGVGPTLANYGVTGPLADPQLRVFDASGQVLAQNDNWGGGADLQAQFAALGAAPLTSPLDAALRITLPPGVYTAQVSSTDGRTGVALVEVYEVP